MLQRHDDEVRAVAAACGTAVHCSDLARHPAAAHDGFQRNYARRDAYGLGVCGRGGVQAWAEKSTALSMNVLKKNLDSYKVRVTSNIVCEGVEKNDTHYLSKVSHLRRPALSRMFLLLSNGPSILFAAISGEPSSVVFESRRRGVPGRGRRELYGRA
jgi:hypothetical protein